MSTLWVRRQYRKSRVRETWTLGVFAFVGAALGAGAFLLLERLSA